MRLAIVCFAAAALALAACSRKAADQQAAVPPPPPPPPAQKTVFDTQFKALQKAKDVQKTVDQQKHDAEAKVQEEGGG